MPATVGDTRRMVQFMVAGAPHLPQDPAAGSHDFQPETVTVVDRWVSYGRAERAYIDRLVQVAGHVVRRDGSLSGIQTTAAWVNDKGAPGRRLAEAPAWLTALVDEQAGPVTS